MCVHFNAPFSRTQVHLPSFVMSVAIHVCASKHPFFSYAGSPGKLFDECSPPSLHLGYEAKPANEGRYKRLKTRHTQSQQQVSAGENWLSSALHPITFHCRIVVLGWLINAVSSVDIPAGTPMNEEPAVPDLETAKYQNVNCLQRPSLTAHNLTLSIHIYKV